MRTGRFHFVVALALAASGCTPDAEALTEAPVAVSAPRAAVTLSSPPGSLLNEQILTGSGIYVPTPGTTTVYVRQQAAGGGGGGVGAGGFGVGAAGGGNSGIYLEYIVPLTSGGAYNAGTGGAGGTGVPTAGGTGGDATIVLNATTYVAKGGTGGGPGVKATSGVTGPALPAQGSTAVPIVTYSEGGLGWWSGTVAAASGKGGNSPFGAGGVAVGVGSGGIAGVRGAGGSGGASNTSAVGGPGGDGIIVVDEYADVAVKTPNGCTDVALTSPAASFAIALGASLPLSATSTCPSGVMPEYEFWVKRVRDAGFTQTLLGGYRTTSMATFTPPTADAWCVTVAVRAVGAVEAFQALSPAVCGTVGQAPPGDLARFDLAGAGWIVRQSSTGFPNLSSDGVWAFDPSTQNEIVHEVNVPAGFGVSSIQVHLNRNNINPLHGDVTVALHRRTIDSQTFDIPMSTIISSGSSWTTITLSPTAGAIVPAVGQVMWLSIQTAGGFSSGQSPLFDDAAILFSL